MIATGYIENKGFPSDARWSNSLNSSTLIYPGPCYPRFPFAIPHFRFDRTHFATAKAIHWTIDPGTDFETVLSEMDQCEELRLGLQEENSQIRNIKIALRIPEILVPLEDNSMKRTEADVMEYVKPFEEYRDIVDRLLYGNIEGDSKVAFEIGIAELPHTLCTRGQDEAEPSTGFEGRWKGLELIRCDGICPAAEEATAFQKACERNSFLGWNLPS